MNGPTKLTCEAVARAALGQPLKREGKELLFRCANPTGAHRNGDAHPSLKVNPQKNAWICGPCNAGGTAWKLAAFLAKVNPDDKAAVTAWLREHGLLNGRREIVTVYPYLDAEGKPIGRVVRTNPKGFYQERPDGKGGWEPGGF